MDNKQFITTLARKCGLDYKDTASAIPVLGDIFADSIAEGDTLAVAGFGNFNTVKHDEEIVDDVDKGIKLLMPPHITILFTPSRILTNKL